MLEQARIVPELVVWLRVSILDSDCLAAQEVLGIIVIITAAD